MWKIFDELDLNFASNNHNVRLDLFSDDYNPFEHMGSTYNIWHVVVIIYNLLQWMLNILLSLVTLVPTNLTTFDIYMCPQSVNDKQCSLWWDEIYIFNSHKQQ